MTIFLIALMILSPIVLFGPVVAFRISRRKKTGKETTETVEGLVVKIKHNSTRVSRNTQLWLQLRDGEIKELDLNSSDVPDILNLQIGQIAVVTFYSVLMGQKLTKLSFENREKEVVL